MDYATWTLVRTGRLYRRPPPVDDPVASELRALAARDRAADHGPADWSDEGRDRWLAGMKAGTLGELVWRKCRGEPNSRMPWPVFLAMRLVYAVNERRSWNAATASRDG